jgi:hypothetical protein
MRRTRRGGLLPSSSAWIRAELAYSPALVEYEFSEVPPFGNAPVTANIRNLGDVHTPARSLWWCRCIAGSRRIEVMLTLLVVAVATVLGAIFGGISGAISGVICGFLISWAIAATQQKRNGRSLSFREKLGLGMTGNWLLSL